MRVQTRCIWESSFEDYQPLESIARHLCQITYSSNAFSISTLTLLIKHGIVRGSKDEDCQGPKQWFQGKSSTHKIWLPSRLPAVTAAAILSQFSSCHPTGRPSDLGLFQCLSFK